MKIKPRPQRWQDEPIEVDVVICFEERVFDTVVEDVRGRSGGGGEPLLVINMVRETRSPSLFAFAYPPRRTISSSRRL